MDKFIGGAVVLWAFITLWFIGKDIIKGIRSRKMAGIPVNGSVTMANVGSGSITLGGNTTTSVTVNSPMIATDTMWIGDVDVGENIQLFRFFLQTRYPEVFEEFNAIEKIKKS